MTGMTELINEKLERLGEKIVQVTGEFGNTTRVAHNPGPLEINSLIKEDKGLRILVGADEFSDTLIVWVNAPDITHLDMAEQFGMSLYDSRDVPLEMSPSGEMRVTISIESTQLDSPRAVEDVLDRNQKYQRLFSDKPIDYSELLDR